MIRLCLIFSVLFLFNACAYPTSSVSVLDDRPSIFIKNAPEDATLFVDGLEMGQTSLYNGSENVLLLEPGTHKVEVRNKGTVIHLETIFLGDGETKPLSVGSK